MAAQSADGSDSAPTIPPPAPQNSLPDEFPVITDTTSQYWAQISGDCIAYRDENGGVYLHNLASSETITITDKSDQVRKVAISQGVVVWRSERQAEWENGLWGYYDPSCSNTRIFGDESIGPFHIVARDNAHAPALSGGEMLTFDTWSPKGWHFVAFIELDADNNDIPDASEPGYVPWNPDIENVFTPISYPFWEGEHGQRVSDIYWDDDYKIACWYSDSGGNDRTECLDLNYLQEPNPWNHRFIVSSDARTVVDYQGVIAVHRDLVIWTDYRDSNLSGYDLYIADLDLDDDGILNPDDPDPGEGPSEFVLVNRPWHQEHPDIWWPFAVWTDGRDGGQQEIYAYDLSLDSDGDGIPNWKDPNRACIDPAEIQVTSDPALQQMPEIYSGTVIWEDWRNGNGDIYSATLEPLQPQPRLPISGTAQEKAIYWLDKQTIYFPQVQHIPGYIAATEMISRYKSFTQGGDVHVLKAWYEAITGSYTVSFDFCYFGTPDQKRFLGRFGRGFTYDQALVLIARTMLSQQTQGEELGRHVSSFQNSGQLTTTISSSFGFSFNGQGYWGEKDNFYDMDYLRGGANGWLGYGYLFYDDHYNDPQFRNVITGIADYILSLQILDPITDTGYGLFKGGYGRWSHENPDEFIDGEVGWVSAEHNIDIYFFLRDLGELTGDSRYIDAANLQRENMINLWNEVKGRFDQGLGVPLRALDAASWGAMYWTDVGDLVKAKRSLAYADNTYNNTVTVSNTVTMSPEITVWGYKPYSGFDGVFNWRDVDLVWSEGSLGVAMANLKLGYALLNQCHDARGNSYIQKVAEIVAEMEKLQTLDPEGGLFYSAYPDYPDYPGGVITDFARAPSAAGTTWLLMVQKAMEDGTLRDAFWGPDEGFSPSVICLPNVTITGPPTGITNTAYTFTANISPTTTTQPITYVWQATGHDDLITHTNGLSDSVSFNWLTPGVQTITVTATNVGDTVTDVHTITIAIRPISVTIDGPLTGIVGESDTFTATVNPGPASLPITYTWSPSPDAGQGTPVTTYTWNTKGIKTITVTATNAGGSTSDTYTVTIIRSIDDVAINGPTTGIVEESYTFTATVSPGTASLPITYTWSPTPTSDSEQGMPVVTYTWTTTGPKTITVTATNAGGTVTGVHTILIIDSPPWKIYLPIVSKN